MAKRLGVLIAVLTVMLAVVAPAAVAQQGQSGPTILTATGVLVGPVEDGDPDPTPEYRLTDEVTGTAYNLISGFVDLAGYAGQRVTIEGVRVPGIDPNAFNVTAIQPAGSTGGTVTATSELTVECQPPMGTEFSGSIGQGPAATGALLD